MGDDAKFEFEKNLLKELIKEAVLIKEIELIEIEKKSQEEFKKKLIKKNKM